MNQGTADLPGGSPEWLDTVDAQDQVTGQMEREQYWRSPPAGHYVRVVCGFVQNGRGELWIPRRSHTKRIAPGCLDTSVCGHVQAGESYDAAFGRELQEELGWHADALECQPLGTFSPVQSNLSTFTRVYRIYSDSTPPYNQADFCAGEWLSVAALRLRLDAGDPARPDLRELVTLCAPWLS